MTVVKYQPDGVPTDRLDPLDIHPFLAEHQHPFARAVPLDFRGGGMNAQVLGGKIESLSVGETDFQPARTQAQFQADGMGAGFGHGGRRR